MKFNQIVCKLLVIIVSLTWISCSKSSPSTQFIPKDAFVVSVTKGKNINAKFKEDGFSFEDFNKQLQIDSIPNFGRLKNLQDSVGIDFEEDIVMAVIMSTPEISLLASSHLKDANQARAYLNKEHSGSEESKDGISYWKVDENVLIAIKDKTIYTYVDLSEALQMQNSQFNTTVFHQYLTQKSDQSINAVDAFQKVAKSNADTYWFFNLEKYFNLIKSVAGQQNGMEAAIMDKFMAYTIDTYVTGTLNSEKGGLAMDYNVHAGENLQKLLKEGNWKDADLSSLYKYAGSKPVFQLAQNMDFNVILALIRDMGFEGIVNMTLAQANLDVKTLTEGLSGNISFSVGDVNLEGQSASYFFHLKSANPEQLAQLLKNPNVAPFLVQEGDTYVLEGDFGEHVAVQIKGADVYVANSEEFLNACLQNDKKVSFPDKVKLKGNSFLYLDLAQVIYHVNQFYQSTDTASNTDVMNFLKDFDYFSGITQISKNEQKSDFYLAFKDPSKQGITTLTNMYLKLFNFLLPQINELQNFNPYTMPDTIYEEAEEVEAVL
jgi:hypothetical protein